MPWGARLLSFRRLGGDHAGCRPVQSCRRFLPFYRGWLRGERALPRRQEQCENDINSLLNYHENNCYDLSLIHI